MTSRRAAGLLFVLPVMVSVSTGSAWAEDPSSTVVKSSTPSTAITTGSVAPGTPAKPQGLTEPQEQLRPSIGDDQPTGAAPPADEIAPSAMDEGAGWEAAVEAAPGPTPLIGEQQAKAVSASTPISTASPICKAASTRSIPPTSTPPGASTCSGRARSGSTTRRRARSVSSPTASSSPSRIPTCKTVEKYPIKSTPFRLLLTDAVDLGRDARIVGVESEEGTLAISLEDKGAMPPAPSSSFSTAGAELRLKQWLITDAQGLDHAGDGQRHRSGPQSRRRLLHLKDGISSRSVEEKAVSAVAESAQPRRGPRKLDGNQSDQCPSLRA